MAGPTTAETRKGRVALAQMAPEPWPLGIRPPASKPDVRAAKERVRPTTRRATRARSVIGNQAATPRATTRDNAPIQTSGAQVAHTGLSAILTGPKGAPIRPGVRRSLRPEVPSAVTVRRLGVRPEPHPTSGRPGGSAQARGACPGSARNVPRAMVPATLTPSHTSRASPTCPSIQAD